MTFGEFQAASCKWHASHQKVFATLLSKEMAEYLCRQKLVEIVYLAKHAGRPLNDIATDLCRDLQNGKAESNMGDANVSK